MEDAKRKRIFVIGIIIVLIILFFLYINDKNSIKTSSLKIQPIFYKGQRILPFSFYEGQVADDIQFMISITNNQLSGDLVVTVSNASTNRGDSNLFRNSIVGKPSLVINPSQSKSWVTDKISTSSYEGSTETRFNICIHGETSLGGNIYKKDSCVYLDVLIQPQSDVYVNFRTNNLNYTTGTKIAISRICGQRLISYSKHSVTRSYDYYCNSNDQDLTIPSSNGTTKLWYDPTNFDVIYICTRSDVGTSNRPYLYNRESTPYSTIDLSPTVVNISKEIGCIPTTCPTNKEALILIYSGLAPMETKWLGEACFNVDVFPESLFTSVNWEKPYDIIITERLAGLDSAEMAFLRGKINGMPSLLTYHCNGPDVYWSASCGSASKPLIKTMEHPILNGITFPYSGSVYTMRGLASGVDSLAYQEGEPTFVAIAKLEHGAELKDGSTKYGRGVFISGEGDMDNEIIFKNAVNWITATPCGNGRVDSGEICDGLNLNGNDCTTIGQGFTGGKLACSFICNSWNTLQCTKGTVVFRTNKNLSYRADVWIAVDCDKDGNLDKYGYSTYSTYDCILENIFETTYDGYNICTRPSYLCSDRVYVETDYGLIYKYNYGAGVNAITTITPCCDTTCGPCCEKYSDGISDC